MGKCVIGISLQVLLRGVIYFVETEDKTSVYAFLAIMTYLFRIDNKIDEKDN